MSFDGIEHSFTLNGISACIIIQLTMNKQDRCFYFMCTHKRAHVVIYVRGFPISAILILKAKRCQGAVVGTAARNPGFEKFCMGKKIRCHKCSVTMTTNRNPVSVTYTHLI